MALRFIDSFDHYVTADLAKKWTGVVNSPVISPGNGRRATNSVRVSSLQSYVTRTLDNQQTWTVGFAYKQSNYSIATTYICSFTDVSTIQVALFATPTGQLRVTRSTGTILGTSTATLTANAYQFIECKVTIHASTGSVEVRVNGVAVLTLTNQNTQQSANAYANALSFGYLDNNVWTADYDDLYICDGTGGTPHNTFLGDCRIDTLLPNADATPLQWTPSTGTSHFALVDETAPNTTDYISNSTAGQRDIFNLQDITAATGTIFGAQLNVAALKSDAGARSIKTLISSGASEALTAAVALGTSQTYLRQIQVADPATSVAWTEAGINSMCCGVETA